MSEQPEVRIEPMVRVDLDDLIRSVRAIFSACGVSDKDALIGAEVLAMTDLRGVESHGVSNMLRHYVDGYRTGLHNPSPEWKTVRETAALAVIDGDRGLGLMQGPPAMQQAIRKAQEVGVGIVTVRNSGHLGAAGHHALLAAEAGMIGVCMSGAGPIVLPTFGAEPRLGSNPIALAAPAENETPLLFDVATTVVAINKLANARRNGLPVEPGWIARTDGSPIMEHVPVPEFGDFYMLPLGGTREHGSHKGYGFGLMAEVLSSFLSGATPIMLGQTDQCKHYFAAYDISAFSDMDAYRHSMDEMLRMLRETRPAPGNERVLYPGMLEREAELDRRENGIPLHRDVIHWFEQMAMELSTPRLVTIEKPA